MEDAFFYIEAPLLGLVHEADQVVLELLVNPLRGMGLSAKLGQPSEAQTIAKWMRGSFGQGVPGLRRPEGQRCGRLVD